MPSASSICEAKHHSAVFKSVHQMIHLSLRHEILRCGILVCRDWFSFLV